MPAKKKGGRSKSAGGAAAKSALAAREAELQRHIADRELVRSNETLLRKRIEEEERATFESQRHKEGEARHRVEELVRKAQYEARENELTAELKQKEAQLQEAQAAFVKLQQSNELLESEKASALRRIALLSNELELAQLNVVESERRATAADQGHQEALKELEGEFDALKQKYHELLAQYTALETQVPPKVSELAADDNGPAEEEATPAAPPSDAEMAALLRVMQMEVERYKATAAQLMEELTRARKEEEKSNLLVGVLNTQLEAVREDNKRLHELSLKYQSEVEASGQMRREAQEARQVALAEMDQALSTAAVQQRQLQLESEVHRKEAEKLAKELSTLRDVHTALSEELAKVSEKAAAQAAADLAANVAMQAELANQKKDLQLALKAKEVAEDEKFNHKILTRAEIESLKARLQRLQETMERKDRESSEVIAVLRADATKQQSLSEQQIKEHDAEVTDLHARLLTTLTQNEALHGQLETLQKTSKERERDLYEQLTNITAYHTAANEELDRLRASTAQKDAEYTNNFVCLTAERENLKMKLSEMTETVAEHKRMHAEIVEQMRQQTEELKAKLVAEAEAQRSACAKETARADLAERNAHRLQDHVRDVEYNVVRTNESHDEAVKCLQAESRDLRSELSIAKRTIARLEAALGDLASYRQLTELNDRLTKDYEKAQQVISSLNGKVVLLQEEVDTMGSHTVRKVQEEKEQLTRRLRQVERRYKLMAPLFSKLRKFAEPRLSPAMQAELIAALESFDQELSVMPKQSVADLIVENDVRSAEQKAVCAAVAAAGTTNCAATIPKVVQPRPPSTSLKNEKLRNASHRPLSSGSSVIVTGTNTVVQSRDPLPAIV